MCLETMKNVFMYLRRCFLDLKPEKGTVAFSTCPYNKLKEICFC